MSQPPYHHGVGPEGPTPPKKSRISPGLVVAILVGVGVVGMVVIVGVLGGLGIYGTSKYIANAKAVEARNALGQMARQAVAAYESEDERLCPSARSPVPASIQSVSGKKYQSSPSEWESDPGFSCLQFEMLQPQYYQYDYDDVGDGFSGIARGDLNGDGVLSTFEIKGQIAGGMLSVAPMIVETDPHE